MHTLFPVQTPVKNGHIEAKDKPNIEVIQWALISHLVECFLLEQWVEERYIQVTTTTEYLATYKVSEAQNIHQFLALLPQP